MPDRAFDFSLKINGAEITEQVRSHLTRLEFSESLTDTAALTIQLNDSASFLLKRQDLLRTPLGIPVQLSLGYFGRLTYLFSGNIIKVAPKFPPNGACQLAIMCYDVSQRFKMEPEPTIYDIDTYPNAYVIARHIVEGHGCKLVVSPESRVKRWLSAQQTNQLGTTDWELLNSIAENLHMRLFARDDTVYLVDDDYLESKQSEKWTFIYGVGRSELGAPRTAPLLSFEPKLSSWGQMAKCTVEAYTGVVKEGGIHKGTAEIPDAYHDGRNYLDVLVTGDTSEILHIRGIDVSGVNSDAEAAEIALNYLRARADKLVQGEGTIPGNAAIRAGTKHTFVLNGLGDFGKLFSGDYWISAVKHAISVDAGFTTTIDIRRNNVSML